MATAEAVTSTPAARLVSSTNGESHSDQRRHVRAVLHDVGGNRIGVVDISARRHGGNEVSIHAWNLTPGFHGVHIHTVGVCNPAGAKPFASAGGHFNPTGTSEGMQAGAFPVLLAGADGRAQTEFVDSNFTIGQLSGPSGTAIVVHAGVDNYANIPVRYSANGVAGPDSESQMTGDSGPRIACAVVFPSTAQTTTATTTPTTTPTSTPTTTSTPGMSTMPGMSSPPTKIKMN
jgi:Cu-Zn family superoxide dismutase